MIISKELAAKRRAVHAACRDLGMDEDERRAMLYGVACVRSTTDLDLVLCNKVLNHLRGCGAAKGKKAGQYPGRPSTVDRVPQLQKIEALLADMKLPWKYAESVAKNVTGGSNPEAIAKLGWVRDPKHLQAIITALVKKQDKMKTEQRSAG